MPRYSRFATACCCAGRSAELRVPQITVNGVVIEYRLLRTRQNRHMRLTVSSNTGVRVSAPRHYPDAAMHALVREKAEWIIEKLREYDEQRRSKPRLDFRDGAVFSVHGEAHTLRVRPWEKRSGRVRLEPGELHIDVPANLENRADVVRSLCEAWLRNYARWYLHKRTMELGEAAGRIPARISVRRQTSKWGSCTAKGSISLNILLVCLPRETCDYVLIHELAHLKELNHSRKFWKLVEQACPDFRRERIKLRESAWLLDSWDEDDE